MFVTFALTLRLLPAVFGQICALQRNVNLGRSPVEGNLFKFVIFSVADMMGMPIE